MNRAISEIANRAELGYASLDVLGELLAKSVHREHVPYHRRDRSSVALSLDGIGNLRRYLREPVKGVVEASFGLGESIDELSQCDKVVVV